MPQIWAARLPLPTGIGSMPGGCLQGIRKATRWITLSHPHKVVIQADFPNGEAQPRVRPEHICEAYEARETPLATGLCVHLFRSGVVR
jgi:hypothetical protein